MKPLLFYDVEVYPNRYFAVFGDIDGNKRTVHCGEELGKSIADKAMLIGYNSNSYDDAVFDNWGLPPEKMHRLSQMIIKEKASIKYKRYSFDLMRQMKNDPSVGVGCPGLKEIAFNKGRNPKQTPIPFDKPLSDAVLPLAVEYCENDVDETIDIFKDKQDFFETLFFLQENYGFKHTQTSAANIDRLFSHTQKPFVDLPKWREQLDRVLLDLELRYDTIEVMSGDGGVHGAEPSCEYRDVFNLDVTSHYPTIVINFGLLGEKTPLFESIYKKRLELKAKKNDRTAQIEAGGLKIVLNTTYGVVNGDKGWFAIEDKTAGTFVCVYGQYTLCVLMRMLLDNGATIIQINTDGVMFAGIDEATIAEVKRTWEKQYSMELELDKIKHVIQKDVNNYVAVFANGKVKTKGGDLGNSQGRRIYRKNLAVPMDKMVYNILMGEKITDRIEHYDYARFLRPTEVFPVIQFGERFVHEGIVVLPADGTGMPICKLKPDGTRSKFTNIERAVPYSEDVKISDEVVKEYMRAALDKVFGRYKKNGELYAGSRPWKKDPVLKNLYYDVYGL